MAQPHEEQQGRRRPALPGGLLALAAVLGLVAAAVALRGSGGPAPAGPLAAHAWLLAAACALGGTGLAARYRNRGRERDTEIDASPRTERVRTAVFAALAVSAAAVPVALLLLGRDAGDNGDGAAVPTQLPTASGPPATTEATAPPAGRGRPGGGLVLHVSLFDVLLALGALALLAAAAVAAAYLLRARRPAPAARATPPEGDQEALAEAVGAGRRALHGTDTRAAVIACYAAMEGSLAASGVPRLRADSPADLLERATARGVLADPAPAARLAALFREARFSSHPMGSGQLAEARAALDTLAAALPGPVAAAASAAPSGGAR